MTLKKEKSNITQKIANKKLEDLGVVEKEQASVLGGTNEKNISNPTPSLFQYTQSRKSNTKKGANGYTSTSREEYRKRFPSVKTPSVFSKVMMDEKLREIAGKYAFQPHLCPPMAFADEALMKEMVDVLYRYVGDVLEGMDLIYNSASCVKDKNKEMLMSMILSCSHMNEEGNFSHFYMCEKGEPPRGDK
jgi:hypothetical protein|tara:strand:- start:8092 stop:8661 length:570 start_codon:yes stop_codon:yes gene_type:complete